MRNAGAGLLLDRMCVCACRAGRALLPAGARAALRPTSEPYGLPANPAALPPLAIPACPRSLSGYIFDEKVAIARTYLEPQARALAGCAAYSSERVAGHGQAAS